MLLDSLPIKKGKSFAIALFVGALTILVCQLLPDNPILGKKAPIEENDLYHADNYTTVRPEIGDDLYVPLISIVKSAPVLNGSDCGDIPFTYTIRNQSTNGESFVNVVITDTDLGGIIAGPDPSNFSGDTPLINPDGILSPGETWTFNFNYNITQNDLESGSFGEMAANVNADVQGQGISVGDMSHPSDPNDDAPTIVDLTACRNPEIGLVKGWEYVDLDGENPSCAENFLYTFTVRNLGNLDLQNIVLEDGLLGGTIPGPTPASDPENDGILAPGEQWQYQALFSADLNQSGTIVNQATVFGETRNLGIQVSDLSDNDNNGQNLGEGTFGSGPGRDDETTAPYDEVCTGAFARIGLVKTASPLDTNNDGCPETILYTFTLRNVGDVDVEEVELTDDLLGGVAPTLISNGNGDDVLAVSEEWTYEAQYAVTPTNIINGSVSNDAIVSAKIVNFDIYLFDHSDDNSFDENDATIEQTSGYCAPPGIALIKNTGANPGDFLVDLDSDGCPETLHYGFTVTNTGGMDLRNVVLDDPLLGGPINGPIPSGNNDDILSVGETWTYEAFYPLTQPDLDAGQVTNQATVTANEIIANSPVSDISDHSNLIENRETVASTIGACLPQAEIGLIKSASGGLLDLDGDTCPETIRYTFTVANTGNVILDNVILNDPNLGGEVVGPMQGTDDGNDGILSINESWTYEGFYPISQQDIDAGQVSNQATVTAQEQISDNPVSDLSDNDSFNENDATITSTAGACVGQGNIGLIKTANSPLLDLNNDGCPETIQYTFTLSNIGALDLEQIVLNDPNLGGEVSGPIQGSDTGEDGILSTSETWTYEAYYPISQPDLDTGQVVNQAEVSAVEVGTSNQISDFSDDSSLIENDQTITSTVDACVSQANIGLIKTTTGGLLDLDGDNCPETIGYEFTVSNTGVIDLEQLTLNDPILGGQINGPVAGSDTNMDGILSTGETWTYEAFYPISQSDIDAGQVINQAQVTAMEVGTNNQVSDLSDDDSFAENDQTLTSTVGACVSQARIGLIKATGGSLLDLNGDGCPETIQYTFTLTNTGSIALEQVVLSDSMVQGSITGPLPGNDINNDAILSPNETWIFQAQYPINQMDIDLGMVTNQAEVTAIAVVSGNAVSDFSDDNSFNEDDSTITSVAGACIAMSGIALEKSSQLVDLDGDACAETIQYNFRVQNTGTINLYQVAVIDNALDSTTITGPLQGNDLNSDGVLSINEIWNFQAQYTITQTDIDSGFVVNQAQVEALEQISNNVVSATSNEVTTPISDGCIDPTNPVDPNFEIFNALTPNGDGKNDFFQIDGIENYPNNVLRIFNRWGVLVYEAESYGSVSTRFNGQSQGQGTIAKERALPSGTYFYTLTFSGTNPGQENYSGYLYISQE
ncbi:gliding motility-associated C-terminal domain-containing protein [Muricauda sp. ANG21]|uniref:gliding motility-associated C-terminal domain-containing protein n=1 Tax=Allomuricauda sp. ANG21 TaxID=3042468 RepID=UPI0034514FEF